MNQKKMTKKNWKELEGKDKYKAYLISDEWKEIRNKVFARDKYRCRCCGRTEGLSAHHSEYTVLFHEEDDLDTLITLCKYCHSGIHRVKSNINRFRIHK